MAITNRDLRDHIRLAHGDDVPYRLVEEDKSHVQAYTRLLGCGTCKFRHTQETEMAAHRRWCPALAGTAPVPLLSLPLPRPAPTIPARPALVRPPPRPTLNTWNQVRPTTVPRARALSRSDPAFVGVGRGRRVSGDVKKPETTSSLGAVAAAHDDHSDSWESWSDISYPTLGESDVSSDSDYPADTESDDGDKNNDNSAQTESDISDLEGAVPADDIEELSDRFAQLKVDSNNAPRKESSGVYKWL